MADFLYTYWLAQGEHIITVLGYTVFVSALVALAANVGVVVSWVEKGTPRAVRIMFHVYAFVALLVMSVSLLLYTFVPAPSDIIMARRGEVRVVDGFTKEVIHENHP